MKQLLNDTFILSAPDFDGLAKWVTDEWLNPAWESILIIVPIVTVLAIGAAYLVYRIKGRGQRQQEPFGETFREIISGAIVVEVAATVIKFLFG